MMSETSENTTSSTSMSSVEGFPAKISALLEKVQGWLENALACGQNTSESLAKFDHNLSSWRMSQPSGNEGSAPFSEIFPKSGMTRSGFLFGLPMWGHHTDVKGCSSWPTPQAQDCAHSPTNSIIRQKRGSQIQLVNRVGLIHNTISKNAALSPAWVEQLMGFPDGWTDGLPAPVKNKKSGKRRASLKGKLTTKPQG